MADDWTLPDEWRATARDLGLSDVQIEKQARRFSGHWTTASGRNAIKRNWQRAWQNWLEKEIDDYGLKPAMATTCGPAAQSPAPWWQDPQKLASVDDAGWRRLIGKHANGTWQIDKLGWPPGDSRSVVPRHIVEDMQLTRIFDHRGIRRPGA